MPDASEQILRAATELRSALNRVDVRTWRNATIEAFPRGACGHCAELLARYLKEKLGIDATYASGNVRHLVNAETHAWLEYGGLFIDISADQFGLEPVFVEPQSAFHEQATDVDRNPIIQDGWWAQYAADVYRSALANITSSELRLRERAEPETTTSRGSSKAVQKRP